jgi:hypothetical protein
MKAVTKLTIGLGVALVAACTDTESTTNLNAVGPPMLRQVRMKHKIANADGTTAERTVFAFGSHELAEPDELKSNQVTSGVVVGQSMRLVIDELLVGNSLEEVACRSAVDEDTFSRVPLGATPDDIARCAVADDVLPSSCTGPTAMCICAIAGGCTSLSTGALIAEGSPVGVLDTNQDGAADDTQMIAGSVGINCGSISVPISLENSYWNPSGDQNRPAQGGFNALGPAIVLTPDGPIPTNLDCSLAFAADVVDKQGIQVCAPPNGDINESCTPGDMSQFSFHSEVLDIRPASFVNGQVGVSRTGSLVLGATAPLDMASVVAPANITLTAETGPAPTFTVEFAPAMNNVVSITIGGAGLSANTLHRLTITPNVTDTFDQPVPAPLVYTFTTN